MGKRQVIEIDNETFATQAEARERFRGILYKYRLNQSVDQADDQFLRAALARHPDAFEKVGPGVKHFEVRSADYGTRCFWVVRLDGTAERFSFKECYKGSPEMLASVIPSTS